MISAAFPYQKKRRQVLGREMADWLATSGVPKLFVKSEPGLLVAGGANLDFARRLKKAG